MTIGKFFHAHSVMWQRSLVEVNQANISLVVMSKYAQNKNQRVSRSNYAEYASLSNIKFCGNILHLADRQLEFAFLPETVL